VAGGGNSLPPERSLRMVHPAFWANRRLRFSAPVQEEIFCGFTNLLPPHRRFCTGSTPATLTGATTAGAPVYLWQSSTTFFLSGFAAASGTTMLHPIPLRISANNLVSAKCNFGRVHGYCGTPSNYSHGGSRVAWRYRYKLAQRSQLVQRCAYINNGCSHQFRSS